MSNDYIGDLKDFKDYDFGIYYFDECAWAYKWKWGKASSEDYEQFLKDKWGTDDEYNVNWYNVCFDDYSNVCDDHVKNNFNYNNSTMYSKECKEYSTMAILNEACLSNRMDIIYYITEMNSNLYMFESKNHTFLDIFERCVSDKKVNIEIIKWIIEYNTDYNCYEGIRETDIDDAVSSAWCEDNKNVIELFYDINPEYVYDDENENLDELFNTACEHKKLDIAKWLETLNDKYHLVIDNDKITQFWIDNIDK
jgi:hypothetical protein